MPKPVRFRAPLQGTIAVLAVVALQGCMSLAPDYERPQAPVPETYPAAQADKKGVQAHELPWQSYFTDPVLKRLISTAIEHNRDLRIAVLRVEEARAAHGIQRSDLFPHFSADGQGGRARTSAGLSPTGQARTGSEYRAEVGLTTWELDLWGRVSNLNDAALERWLATEAAQQAVQLALVTEVANVYLSVRELDERVKIARQTLATRQQSYRMFQDRFEVGSTSQLDLTQVRTLLLQARSLLAQLERQRALQINALRLLLGGDPGDLGPVEPFDRTTMLVEIDPGLPSELLVYRPDIIAAEHRLRAANADIGAARAAFLPRIALTGAFGTASAQLDDLFGSGSHTWSFMPTISLPIFDGGRREANLELSEVRRDLAVADYERTIQNAFREVSDALDSHRWLQDQLKVLLQSRAAQSERSRLAQLRYDQGSVAYLEVLDAQRDLLDVQQQVVQTRRALLASQVDLYRALGGATRTNQDNAAQDSAEPEQSTELTVKP